MKLIKLKILSVAFLALCLSVVNVYGAEDIKIDIMQKADKAYQSGQYDKAAAYYRVMLAYLEGRAKTKPSRLVSAVRYRLGLAQLAQGKPEPALANMKDFYEQNPSNPYVVRGYAEALFQNKKYQEAIPVFEKAATLDKTFQPRSYYYTGMAKYFTGQAGPAIDDLEKARKMEPQSREGKNAGSFLADLEKNIREVSGMEKQASVTAIPGRPTKEKPWAVSLSAGMEYDSNIALIPSEQTRPSDISSDGDWRAVYSLGGVYEFVNTGKNFFGAQAGIYGTQQFKDNMFNVQSGGVSLYYKGNIADTFQVRLTPFVSQTLLQASSYSWTYGITPGVSWQPVRWTWTDLNYTYSKAAFTEAPQYPEENRNGKNHNVNLRQNLSFPSLFIAERTTFFAGWLNYGVSETDGSSYAYHSEGFGVMAQQEFPRDFTFLVSYGYNKTKYDNGNIRSATNEKRNDTGQTVTANVFKKLDMLLKNLSAYAGYRWFKNDSNIQNYYSYSSNTYSVGLTLNF